MQSGIRCNSGPAIIATALLLVLAAPAALAFDDDAVRLAAVDTGRSAVDRPQLEVSSSTLPRFDSLDGTTRNSRIDMTFLPSQRSGMGVAVGLNSASTSTLGGVSPFAATSSSVALGLHWRYTLDSNYRFDVTAWRRVPNADAVSLIQTKEPTYGARVEMRMGSGNSKGFVADKGFVGFQLESGARITVKKSQGVPMVYYRNKF